MCDTLLTHLWRWSQQVVLPLPSVAASWLYAGWTIPTEYAGVQPTHEAGAVRGAWLSGNACKLWASSETQMFGVAEHNISNDSSCAPALSMGAGERIVITLRAIARSASGGIWLFSSTVSTPTH